MHRKGQQQSSANTTIIQCHYHPPGYIRQKWRNRAVLVSLTQQFFQAPFLTNNIYNILKENEWESVKWFNFTPVQRYNVESAVATTFATLWMLTIESKIVGISCSLQELLVFSFNFLLSFVQCTWSWCKMNWVTFLCSRFLILRSQWCMKAM